MTFEGFSKNFTSRVKRLLHAEYLNLPKDPLPKGIILGGQPASGKSKLISKLLAQDRDRFVVINGDELRRYHPYYSQYNLENDTKTADITQKLANELSQYLLSEAIRLQLSVIIEGTMRTAHVPTSTAKLFSQNNYTSEVAVISAHFEKSLLGIYQRYEEQKLRSSSGRFSNLDIHKEAYTNLPENIDHIFKNNLVDKISIYTFNAEQLIYSATQTSGKWNTLTLPGDIVSQERNRLLTPREQVLMAVEWSKIIGFQKARGLDDEFTNSKLKHYLLVCQNADMETKQEFLKTFGTSVEEVISRSR